MAYDNVPRGRECTGRPDARRRYVAEMDVFGAIGDSEELPARYHKAVNRDLERPAINVDKQGAVEEWKCNEDPNSVLYTHVDRNDSTFHDQLATRYDVEQPWLENRLSSEPWNSLGLPYHQSGLAHLDSAIPCATIALPTKSPTVGNLGHDGTSASYSHGVATIPASRASCNVLSHDRMEDQSELHPYTTRYDYPSLVQCWSGRSVECAPSRLYERRSGYAETSAEVSSWSSYNNLSR